MTEINNSTSFKPRFTYETYREYYRAHQYILPNKLISIAALYGDVLTYNQIMSTYEDSVKETLLELDIEIITDAPIGYGFLMANDKWERKIKELYKKYLSKQQYKNTTEVENYDNN